MINKATAILSLIPNAKFAINEGSIIWEDEREQPTDSEIETEQKSLQDDFEKKQYQRDRLYPSIGDQLDMQYWDQLNGTTTWKDAIAKVKSDHPKP